MRRNLQVTFRDGRVIAAYLRFHAPASPTARSERFDSGMVVDYADDGSPLGLEFVAPSQVSLSKVNDLLTSLKQPPASLDELWPLVARPQERAIAS